MTLTVNDVNGKRIEVMHGELCVGLLVSDSDGSFESGAVLDPAAARQLASLLEQQAASSERP